MKGGDGVGVNKIIKLTARTGLLVTILTYVYEWDFSMIRNEWLGIVILYVIGYCFLETTFWMAGMNKSSNR